MPLPPEVLAAIKTIATHTDRAEVLEGLRTEAPGLRHEIFQAGHDVGYGKGKGELTAAQGRITELEGKVSKAETDLAEAQKARPDDGKLHADYQKQIADLRAEKDAAVAAAIGKVKQKEHARAQIELQAHLERLGLRKTSARVAARDAADRLVPDDAGDIQVLQPGLAIPFAASGEKTPLVLLAEAIRSKTDPDEIVSHVDTGSGDRSQGAAGELGIVQRIQKEAADRKAAAAVAGTGVGADGLPKSVAGMAIKTP